MVIFFSVKAEDINITMKYYFIFCILVKIKFVRMWVSGSLYKVLVGY